jgi:hypothetical protein
MYHFVKWTDDAGGSKVKILPLAKKYLKAMQELKRKKYSNFTKNL